MFEDEDEILPPREEEIPSRLAKKWDELEKREGVTQCRFCKKQILADSSFCAYCGAGVKSPKQAWVVAIAALLLIIMIVWLVL